MIFSLKFFNYLCGLVGCFSFDFDDSNTLKPSPYRNYCAISSKSRNIHTNKGSLTWCYIRSKQVKNLIIPKEFSCGIIVVKVSM
nr:MAG TPA: hypothetical protein [Caudoviricetes sp.]